MAVSISRARAPRAIHGKSVTWTSYLRNGGEIIANVCTKGRGVSLSTTPSALQARMRPAAAHPAEAALVHPDHVFLYTASKAELNQIRPLIAMGCAVLVRSGKHSVIVDRDPGSRNELVEAQVRRERLAARRRARRGLVRGIADIDRRLELLQERSEARAGFLEEQLGRAMVLLREIGEQGVLSREQRRTLDRIRVQQGADAALDVFRTKTESHLERTGDGT